MRAALLLSALPALALAADGGTYSGLGADSISPQTLARFAPTPLPPELSRRVQAMLDVRSPGAGNIANDGSHLLFGWRVTGTRQVWRLDGPQRFPVQLTGGEDATQLGDLSPDGTWHVVSRDVGGAENPGVFWQAAAGGPLHPIQTLKGVQTFLDFISDDGRWVYFHSNDVKPDSYTLYRWEKATGKREVVFDRDGLWSIADHRPDGRLLLVRELGSAVNEVHEWDPATRVLKPLLGVGEREEYTPAYGAAPGEVLVLTPRLGEFRRLYRLTGGALTPVTPALKYDVSAFVIEPTRRRLLYTVNEDGSTRLFALDAKTFRPLPLPRLPDNDAVAIASVSSNGRYAVLWVDLGNAPAVAYVLDWQTGKATQWQLPSAPEVDLSTFVRATLETYPARDGTPIPMLVRRPPRCANALCPVVVEFHGGPEGQSLPGFSAWAQLFVDSGFIFVEPNVRGSDGYGKTWFHADDGPKRLDIITDIEDAALHARRAFAVNGQAPKVAIVGGSYGGYSTLMGMTRFAGAYDVGVSEVGFSNIATFLRNTAPYRRILRINEYGDPEKDREALEKLSPITYIDRVQGPLLLIQGANDPRVPVGEALQMHDALERRGLASPLILFADEGHGSQKRGNQVLSLGHTIQFLQEHLR
jgi:dipeptidyl aminopeptidase/acylaminoacyl peptidase